MIDVAIPGITGLVLVLWPKFVFFGSKVTPDTDKLRLIRRFGGVLLVIAGTFLLIGVIER